MSSKKPIAIELDQPSMTVGDVVRSVFPSGTHLKTDVVLAPSRVATDVKDLLAVEYSRPGGRPLLSSALGAGPWQAPPELPPDLFAVAGLLLDWSGAAHHVVAEERVFPDWARALVVTDAVRAWTEKQALRWRTRYRLSNRWPHIRSVRCLWRQILAAWDEPVFKELGRADPAPAWWTAALWSLMIADSAAASFGFFHPGDRTLLDKLFDDILAADGDVPAAGAPDLLDVRRRRYTISTACPDVACVLPKSRTASVGCTLRSLSHNLALLPPRGLARATWHSFDPKAFDKVEDIKPLNILLMPYPYDMPARSFVGGPMRVDADYGDNNWFEIEPKWRGGGDGGRAPPHFDVSQEAFTAFVEKLLTNSHEIVRDIGGLVFPECAIPYDYFRALVDRARRPQHPHDVFRSIEFIVAGTTTDNFGRPGNYASSCLLARAIDPRTPRKISIGVQDKHHRWRIDRAQARDYGIGGALPGGRFWWEKIELRSRALNVFNFRESSTFVALICEDLARLEPVHDLVRSIGPNIVFALLLDGPQVSPRWPGRYAVGLSDDPGSSVLTLTSQGLIDRYNRRVVEAYRSESVGLWRDETGETRQIELKPGAAAILLSLSPERKCETSLDGRKDGTSSIRWVYADQVQIFANR